MLRTISPDISIITNWGCKQDCWFCIWKKHKLKNINLKTDWEKLESFINKNMEKGKISVSGGGDCLFDYTKHINWWNKIFKIAEKYNMKVDVHTRQRFYNKKFWNKINKVVVTSDNICKDENYFKFLLKNTKLRIVHVVTAESTINEIEDLRFFCLKNNAQMTLKQLSIYDDLGKYNAFKGFYKKELYFLDEGDYNVYFMPNNEVWDDFMGSNGLSKY